MRLRALDQIHVSSVKTDSLRAGEEFEISDAEGSELLSRHPTILKRVNSTSEKAAPAPHNKAAPQTPNKAASPKATKANPRRKSKGK